MSGRFILVADIGSVLFFMFTIARQPAAQRRRSNTTTWFEVKYASRDVAGSQPLESTCSKFMMTPMRHRTSDI